MDCESWSGINAGTALGPAGFDLSDNCGMCVVLRFVSAPWPMSGLRRADLVQGEHARSSPIRSSATSCACVVGRIGHSRNRISKGAFLSRSSTHRLFYIFCYATTLAASASGGTDICPSRPYRPSHRRGYRRGNNQNQLRHSRLARHRPVRLLHWDMLASNAKDKAACPQAEVLVGFHFRGLQVHSLCGRRDPGNARDFALPYDYDHY